MGETTPVVKSASRTLDIIEFVVKSPKPVAFSAIQQFTGIPKSSLSYLLQELINRGYIQYDAESRVYYAGLALIQLSAACMNNTDVSREIWLGIKALSEELGETTHAGMLDGRYVVYIAKCPGSKDLSVVSTIGHRLPAHATALGKVLLSALDREEVKLRFRGVEFERYTENTIVSEERLFRELDKVAGAGYAIDNQEIIPGGICVAAPILDRNHRTIAAMSVTMPYVRANGDFLPVVIDKVRRAASHVSMRLGKT